MRYASKGIISISLNPGSCFPSLSLNARPILTTIFGCARRYQHSPLSVHAPIVQSGRLTARKTNVPSTLTLDADAAIACAAVWRAHAAVRRDDARCAQVQRRGALSALSRSRWCGADAHALGQFLIPWARPGKCRREAYDDALGEKVWSWLEAEAAVHEARGQR